jgi:hypothetical protein
MWWQSGVIGQGVNDNNSGGDMECKWNRCREVRGREIKVEKEKVCGSVSGGQMSAGARAVLGGGLVVSSEGGVGGKRERGGGV